MQLKYTNAPRLNLRKVNRLRILNQLKAVNNDGIKKYQYHAVILWIAICFTLKHCQTRVLMLQTDQNVCYTAV